MTKPPTKPPTKPTSKIDLATVPSSRGTRYPAPYDVPCRERSWRGLGDAAGLTQFGVNLVELPPGSWSSQRHWHALEDEFVWVVSGQATLVTDAGEEVFGPGDCAGFPAGVRDGHCFQNRSQEKVVLLVVGSRREGDYGEYPELDMMFSDDPATGASRFTRKDGSPF